MKIIKVRNVDSNDFYNTFKEVKTNNNRSDFVDLLSKEEYEKMKTLVLFDDNLAGFAIENNGNIVSIFKDTNRTDFENALDSLMPIAVIHGGTRMDCYGEWLAKKYMKHGFVPVAKVMFNEEYASKSWNYERDGKPDIYFLIRFTNNIDNLIKECAHFDEEWFDYINSYLPYMEYDEAANYSQELINSISNTDNPSYKMVIDGIVAGQRRL